MRPMNTGLYIHPIKRECDLLSLTDVNERHRFLDLLLANREAAHANVTHLQQGVLKPRHVTLLTTVTQARDVVLDFI